MAIGDYLTWAVQAQDAPAHVARILQTILLNEGVVDVAGNSFQVTENTGADMNITIGSGTLGDLAVVEGDDTAGQGVYVIEAQNATVTRTIAASDPSDDRIDRVVLQNYDDEADSSGNNDAEVEVIQGTPAGSPSAPALPDSAIPLAEVLVGAGVTAITNANITDTREEARSGGAAPSGTLAYAEVTSGQSGISSLTDLSGLSVTVEVPANRRIRVSGYGLLSADTANATFNLHIRESTTTLQRWTGRYEKPTADILDQANIQAVLTPSQGSHTYKLSLETAAGTIDLTADSTRPAYIMVEDLGPA